jgi:hypothetical protein
MKLRFDQQQATPAVATSSPTPALSATPTPTPAHLQRHIKVDEKVLVTPW